MIVVDDKNDVVSRLHADRWPRHFPKVEIDAAPSTLDGTSCCFATVRFDAVMETTDAAPVTPLWRDRLRRNASPAKPIVSSVEIPSHPATPASNRADAMGPSDTRTDHDEKVAAGASGAAQLSRPLARVFSQPVCSPFHHLRRDHDNLLLDPPVYRSD